MNNYYADLEHMIDMKKKSEENETVHPRIMLDIIYAVEKAEEKHPHFPIDIVHQSAILAEESGELVQAALDYYYHNGDRDNVKKEALDTIAVCIRILKEGFFK
jgi:NTP pyrophosphatase (non-canonical NTP hydrolase)